MKHEEEIDALFDDLVEKLKDELPDFGKYLAVDGKPQLPEGARYACEWEEEGCGGEGGGWEA